MIKDVVKYEIIKNIYSFRFVFISVILIPLFLSSFYVLINDYKERLSRYEKEKDKEEVITVAPYPLSVLVKGLDEEISSVFKIDHDLRIIWKTSTVKTINPLFSIFPTPDFLFLSKVIFSLASLLFVFDAVSREKEIGSLQMIFSNPISRIHFILSKFIASYITLNIPFLFGFLIGFILFLIEIPINFEVFLRILILFFITQIFIISFLLLGILFSILTKNSSISLITLLFIWVLLVFVIPSLSTLFSGVFSPLPSESYYRQIKMQNWVKIRFITYHRYKSDSLMDIEKISQEFKRDDEKLEEDYNLKLFRYASVAKKISKISPVGVFQDVILSISSTGLREYERLKSALTFFYKSYKGEGRFNFSRMKISEIMDTNFIANLFFLLFINFIFFTISLITFAKSDVRKK